MTNYFKELISFRSLHLMEETYLAETIKEALCFVSQDVKSDLKVDSMARSKMNAIVIEGIQEEGMGISLLQGVHLA